MRALAASIGLALALVFPAGAHASLNGMRVWEDGSYSVYQRGHVVRTGCLPFHLCALPEKRR